MQPLVCLLIDDDSEESEIFHYALEEMTFPIVCHMTNSGREALSLLSSGQLLPDYIFLDLNMPKMDGRQCLKEIRNIDPLHHITVILYSTSFLEGQIKELQLLGANGFITKTTSITELNLELVNLFACRNQVEPLPVKNENGFLPAFNISKMGLSTNI